MHIGSLLLMAPGGQDGGGGGLSFLLFIGLFFVIIYFFMIRPQTKKAKNQRQFLQDIQKGDKIVTIGGIHGRIVQVNDDSYLIEVDGNTKLKIEKSVISLEFTKAVRDRASGEGSTKK
jgi:preprotein translocase subunit YajC